MSSDAVRIADPIAVGEYADVLSRLRKEPRKWLVTGAAGFIGSHLVQHLLELRQEVVGLDNFSTGSRANLQEVHEIVGDEAWAGFRFIEGDIRELPMCTAACEGVDYVLHEAALGSVPRSVADPIATHANNLSGFLNILVAARDAGVKRFVYAASSSTYGDHPGLPKVEEKIGRPLSPYAVTKYGNELYARVFNDTYGVETIGLRYFNVFGPRQDPEGAYAAVIPRWVATLLNGDSCRINGDGETSRDFTYVDNVVQANLLAAVVDGPGIAGEVFNVAYGERTTLNALHELIRDSLIGIGRDVASVKPTYDAFRTGDVRHSHADISKIRERLGYIPATQLREAMQLTVAWHTRDLTSLMANA